MTRDRLENRRTVENFELVWNGLKFIIGIGRDVGSDRIKEVFITPPGKTTGSSIDFAARDIAILLSLLFQHHCPVEVIADALTKNHDGLPEGLAGAVAAEIIRFQNEEKADVHPDA